MLLYSIYSCTYLIVNSWICPVQVDVFHLNSSQPPGPAMFHSLWMRFLFQFAGSAEVRFRCNFRGSVVSLQVSYCCPTRPMLSVLYLHSAIKISCIPQMILKPLHPGLDTLIAPLLLLLLYFISEQRYLQNKILFTTEGKVGPSVSTHNAFAKS